MQNYIELWLAKEMAQLIFPLLFLIIIGMFLGILKTVDYIEMNRKLKKEE